MRYYFNALRGWKVNPIRLMCFLSLVIVLPVMVEARDYRIRASDGELYTVTITFKNQQPNIHDFSVKKGSGEVLRGVTNGERETIVELYYAAKLIGIVRTFHSPNTPPYGGVEWINELSADTLEKLKWNQGATYISGKFVTTLHIIITRGFSLSEAIATEISGYIANDHEKRLLMDATLLAHFYAQKASSEESVLRNLWYSYETRSTIIQIDQIDSAWASFHKMARYMVLTSEIMNKYLLVPDVKERLAKYVRGIVPLAQNIEHLNTITYSALHIQKLQDMHTRNMEQIQRQASSRIVKTQKKSRSQLEEAGFFPSFPDLVVELAPRSNNTLAPGKRFVLSTTVRNAGTGKAAAAKLRYYQSSDAYISTDDTQVGITSMGALNSGGTRNKNFKITAPAVPGTYYYGVCVDDVPGESNTDNNCSTVTIKVDEDPVGNQNPETLGRIPDQTLTQSGSLVSLDLSNYFQDSDGDNLSYTARSDNTNVTTTSVSGNFLTLTPVDAGNATVTVTASDGSSTATQHFTVTVQSANFRVGYSILVQNASGGGLNGLVVRSGAGTGFAHIISVFNGATGTITDGPQQNNGYTWWKVRWNQSNAVLCDVNPCDGWVFESFRGTRVIAKNARQPVNSPGDIDLVIQSVRVSASTLTPGERFKFYATVRNQGRGDADRTTLRYYLSTDSSISTSDTQVETDSVTSLDPNESDEEWDTLTAPDSPGTYYYGTCVDSVSGESNTNNNCSIAIKITVQGTQPPPGLAIGDSIFVQNASGDLNGLIVRSGAGTGFAWIISVFNGATGTITDGPRQNNGYTWWKVRWDHSDAVFCDVNPCDGWVFEFFRGTRVIAKPGLAAPVLNAGLPTDTALLSNYPNPFNPETWIPYQLAKASDVQIAIYDARGLLVRRLALGNQPAGSYTRRGYAAYWDGRNEFGELVASGIYFYTLTAGEFTATRKMLIRK